MEHPKLSPEAQKVLENAYQLMIVKHKEIIDGYNAAKKTKEILDTGITILDEIAGAVHEKNLAKASCFPLALTTLKRKMAKLTLF